MALFVPTTAPQAAAFADRESARYWKVLIDTNDDGTLEDVTGNLKGNQVTGGMNAAGTSQWSVKLRNSQLTYDEGDFANAACAIEAQAGATGYIRLFTGFVSDSGCRREKKGLSDDTISIQMFDRVKSKGTRRKTDPQIYVGFKVCDPASPATSILHQLAYMMGLVDADLDVAEIDWTVALTALDGKATAWRELQRLAEQYLAMPLGFRYDGDLRFFSRFQTGWAQGTSEFTFDEDVNIHSWVAEMRPRTCTRATTEYDEYEDLGARTIYKNTDDWNSTLEQNAIVLLAGEYWPGPAAADKARLHYRDPATGEDFPIGTGITTPTIGATGSGSDIESDGGLPTLVSFNGTTAATQQNADSSEIILQNATGSTITIRKLELRGNAWRVNTEVRLQELDTTVDDEDHVDKLIDGKYVASQDQAHTTVDWEVEWGKAPRKVFDLVVDWCPAIQKGAVVTLAIGTEGLSLSCYVESYTHLSPGTPKTMATVKTSVQLIVIEDFTESGSGTVAAQSIPSAIPEADATAAEIADRPTKDEVIRDGWNTGFGTTTPAVPTITVCEARWNNIYLEWDRQAALTNLDYYGVQVSTDGTNWYSLAFDGTGGGKATLGAATIVYGNKITHTKIPYGGDADNPTDVTLQYKVRATTKTGSNSAYSTVAGATITAIAGGDVGIDELSAFKVDPATFLGIDSTGLAAYWPLNDAGADTTTYLHKDASGNGYDATGDAQTAAVAGPAGPGVDFVASQNRGLATGDLGLAGVTTLSCCAWVKPTLADSEASAILFALHDGAQYNFLINIHTDSKLRTLVRDNAGTTVGAATADAAVITNTLYFVAVTWDGTTLKMYVDGKLQTVTATGTLVAWTPTVGVIGSGIPHSVTNLDGGLYHVRVFTRALSLAEVRYLFLNPAATVQTMVAAHNVIAHSISAYEISVDTLNAMVANIKDNLTISSSKGWMAGPDTATPDPGDTRTYMDENEIALQQESGGGWLDRIRLGSLLAAGDYKSYFADFVGIGIATRASAEMLRVAGDVHLYGGTLSNRAVFFASDAYLFWNETNDAFDFVIPGTGYARFRKRTAAVNLEMASETTNYWGFYGSRGGVFLVNNAYWDGTNWKSYQAAKAGRAEISVATGYAFRVGVDFFVTGADETLTWATLFTVEDTGAVNIAGGTLRFNYITSFSNANAYIYFASDAYILWGESNDVLISSKAFISMNARVYYTGVTVTSGTFFTWLNGLSSWPLNQYVACHGAALILLGASDFIFSFFERTSTTNYRIYGYLIGSPSVISSVDATQSDGTNLFYEVAFSVG